MKSLGETIKIKATEQYFPMVLFHYVAQGSLCWLACPKAFAKLIYPIQSSNAYFVAYSKSDSVDKILTGDNSRTIQIEGIDQYFSLLWRCLLCCVNCGYFDKIALSNIATTR